jgi:hypothetical protein
VRSFALALAVVFVVALGVRVGAVTTIPDGENCSDCLVGMAITNGLGGDGAFYHAAGNALANGRGYVDPTSMDSQPYAHMPPLWTAVVAGAHKAGLHSARQKQLLFAVLGAGAAVLVGVAARQVASDRASILAASTAAFYPGFWLYERNLNSETIAFPLIAIVIILAYRYRSRPGWGRALLLGAAIGVLCTARSEQVLVIPLLLVPLVLSTTSVRWRSRIARLAACGAIIVAMLAPWTIYNLGRFERPVLLSTSFGYTALAGACDTTFDGPKLGSFDSWTCFLSSRGSLQNDRTVADGLLRQSALDYTVAHLDRFPVVVAAREGRSWGVYQPGQQVRFNAQALNAPAPVTWTQIVSYWIVLPLAIAGAVILRRRRVAIYPLLTFPVIVIVSTMVTFGDSRYRATAEISLVIFAAVAIDAVWTRLRSTMTRSSAGVASAPEGCSPDSTAARGREHRRGVVVGDPAARAGWAEPVLERSVGAPAPVAPVPLITPRHPLRRLRRHGVRRRRWPLVAGASIAAIALAGCGGAADPPPAASGPAPTDTTATSTTSAVEPSTTGTSPPSDLVEAACAGRLQVATVGRLAAGAGAELSGIVASRAHPGAFWVNNDSGAGPEIHAIREDGSLLETFDLGTDAIDWEDIAIGRTSDDDGWSLFIGDIGDNNEQRSTVELLRVDEPQVDPTAAGVPGPLAPQPLGSVAEASLTYPDHPHNAEALLVDPDTGQVVIITKELIGPAQVFVADSTAIVDGAHVALTAAGSVDFGAGGLAAWVTGADVSPDGSVIAVRTYGGIHLFERAPGQSIVEALATTACDGPIPLEAQGEAVTITANGDADLTIAEGADALVHKTS